MAVIPSQAGRDQAITFEPSRGGIGMRLKMARKRFKYAMKANASTRNGFKNAMPTRAAKPKTTKKPSRRFGARTR